MKTTEWSSKGRTDTWTAVHVLQAWTRQDYGMGGGLLQTNGDQKKSQKGQFLFTRLSWIKIYIRVKITFKMQALRCCFFLLLQPQCLKKNCWGRTSQKPQTAGAATNAAKAEHKATRFWQDFLILVLLSSLLWISFPLLLPQSHSARAPLHGFPQST